MTIQSFKKSRRPNARLQTLIKKMNDRRINEVYESLKGWAKTEGYLLSHVLGMALEEFFDKHIRKEVEDEPQPNVQKMSTNKR